MTSATRHAHLEPVSPDNAVLLLVDQQEDLFSRIHSRGKRGSPWWPWPGRRGCWEFPRS
jgi:hypothetical protein